MAQPTPAELTPKMMRSVSPPSACAKSLCEQAFTPSAKDTLRRGRIEGGMASGLRNAVDDRLIEMCTDEPHLMALVTRRQAHGRSHDARTENCDHCHLLHRHKIAFPLSASNKWMRSSLGLSPI